MTWLFLEPVDVWLFRDGRPFSAGEEHLARSLFPPSPLTVQGALRSLILGHDRVSWEEYRTQASSEARDLGQKIGYPAGPGRQASLGSFSMAGPFVARYKRGRVERYTPLPADVVQHAEQGYYFALQPAKGPPFKADWPMNGLFPLWPGPTEDIESLKSGGWLSEQALDNYFQGLYFSPLASESLFGGEPRFGIALDYSTRTPVKHMLYQAEFVRPDSTPNEEVGLLVRLDGVKLPSDEGVMAMGGEAKGARYRILKDSDVIAGAGVGQPTSRLKIVFLTPAWFSDGWQPVDGNAGWSRLLGNSVRLVAVATGRPQHIGGWDLAENWHKSMAAYVPAGSVYFFESDRPIRVPSRPLTETPQAYSSLEAQGFGQVVAGTWDWLTVS